MGFNKSLAIEEANKEFENCGCEQELGSGIIHPCAKHEQEMREADAEAEYWELAQDDRVF